MSEQDFYEVEPIEEKKEEQKGEKKEPEEYEQVC